MKAVLPIKREGEEEPRRDLCILIRRPLSDSLVLATIEAARARGEREEGVEREDAWGRVQRRTPKIEDSHGGSRWQK